MPNKTLKNLLFKGSPTTMAEVCLLGKTVIQLYTIQTLILRKWDSKATEKKPNIHDKTITVTVCCVCSILKTPWNVYLKMLFKKIKINYWTDNATFLSLKIPITGKLWWKSFLNYNFRIKNSVIKVEVVAFSIFTELSPKGRGFEQTLAQQT